MEQNKLHGREVAEALGYSLHSSDSCAEDGPTTTYIKIFDEEGALFLTCNRSGQAKLERVIGVVNCKIEWFTFPNKNFLFFEDALLALRR